MFDNVEQYTATDLLSTIKSAVSKKEGSSGAKCESDMVSLWGVAKDIEEEQTVGIIGQIIPLYDPLNKLPQEFNIGNCLLRHLNTEFTPSDQLQERFKAFFNNSGSVPSFVNMSLIGAPLWPVFESDDKSSYAWQWNTYKDNMFNVRGLWAQTPSGTGDSTTVQLRGQEHYKLPRQDSLNQKGTSDSTWDNASYFTSVGPINTYDPCTKGVKMYMIVKYE